MPHSKIHFRLTKKWLIAAVLIIGLIWFLLPHKAHAYGYDWDVQSYDTSIIINSDSTLSVTETLKIDYSREQHRGPIRFIPLKYHDKFGNAFNLRFQFHDVTDQLGKSYEYTTWNEGDYFKIRVGNENVWLNSVETYVFKYTVSRAMLFDFADHDELYWNATGDEWDVPILNATAQITYPEDIPQDQVKATCFTGGYGATEQACTSTVSGRTITYSTTGSLSAFEGLTIAASLPKGYITPPPFIEQLGWFVADNWAYLLPLFTFALLYFLWYTRGKDPKTNRDTIMPIYTPPDSLTPAEVGTLIDEHADMRDLSSTIIDMAVRGYIKIIEITKKKLIFTDKDYEFERLNDSLTGLKDHEQKTMEALFGTKKSVKLSSLKYEFYKDIPGIKTALYDTLISDGYFPGNPENTRNWYYGLGGVLLFLPIFFGGAFIDWSISIPIGIGLSGLVVLLFAKYMPAKTKKGVEEYYKVLGLEEFIRTAETDRIKFQEKENIFEKLLPYAMALNIADKWSKSFEGIYKNAPDWYQSSDPNFINSFNAMHLYSVLNSLNSNMSQTLTAAPRSSGSGGAWSGGSGFSGGGFSGGGFGGGGGSSW